MIIIILVRLFEKEKNKGIREKIKPDFPIQINETN